MQDNKKGLQHRLHETFSWYFPHTDLVKSCKNVLLRVSNHIVQKSHQINTEDHLELLFWKAFEKGLNYENSHDTKVPINGFRGGRNNESVIFR